jgi:hypothetical protein
MSPAIEETLSYQQNELTDIMDFRNSIDVKNAMPEKASYNSVPYTQVLGNKFVSNLSIIDLVFCEGPGAATVVASSVNR